MIKIIITIKAIAEKIGFFANTNNKLLFWHGKPQSFFALDIPVFRKNNALANIE